jgi:hypothetical protein
MFGVSPLTEADASSRAAVRIEARWPARWPASWPARWPGCGASDVSSARNWLRGQVHRILYDGSPGGEWQATGPARNGRREEWQATGPGRPLGEPMSASHPRCAVRRVLEGLGPGAARAGRACRSCRSAGRRRTCPWRAATPSTLAEMLVPYTPSGHGGTFPGYDAAAYACPETGRSAALLANTSTARLENQVRAALVLGCPACLTQV